MSLHDELLDLLVDLADVSLVAALRDEAIGFPDANDLRVFLGDVHLISERRQQEKRYQWGNNHEDLLVGVLERLRGLKDSAAGGGKRVTLYQTGDFLDLWREAPGFEKSLDAAARIKDDHEDLLVALHDLDTRFVFGNHDLDLYRWPAYRAWQRRYYLPDAPGAPPSVLVTHGDVFDLIERYPAALKSLYTYYFSPKEQEPWFDLGPFEAVVVRAHGDRTYLASAEQGTHDLGRLLPMGDVVVPPEYNVARVGSAPEGKVQFLAEASAACASANREYGLHLTAAAIGHTHHARIAVSRGPAPFTLIDAGAWVERNLSGGVPVLNAQIAALSGNEARIYQLSEKGASPGKVVA